MTLGFRKSELFDAVADDLLGERNARPLVIVGASKVDHLLLEILRGFLLPKTTKPKDQDEILEKENAPLSTFSSRIKMCRRLGLIDDTLYRALDKLRVLRNLSAHSIAFDETKSPIHDHLADLKTQITSRNSYRWTKERYFDSTHLPAIEEWQCLLLTICVLLEAIREKVRQTSGNKNAISISKR
jgi:hypothetical protein